LVPIGLVAVLAAAEALALAVPLGRFRQFCQQHLLLWGLLEQMHYFELQVKDD